MIRKKLLQLVERLHFNTSIMIGGGFAMGVAVIMLSELQNKPELKTFPFYVWSLYLCVIGDAIFVIFVMPKHLEQIKLTLLRSAMDVLQANIFYAQLYGICIGLFGLYYAFFLGIQGLYKIIAKVHQCIGWLHKNSCTQVHPVR